MIAQIVRCLQREESHLVEAPVPGDICLSEMGYTTAILGRAAIVSSIPWVGLRFQIQPSALQGKSM